MLNIKQKFVIILISISTTCIAQYNSFFVGFNPNNTFSKVIKQDELNGTQSKPSLGIGLEFGYSYFIIKNTLFVDLSVSALARSYAFTYGNSLDRGQHGQLYLVPEVKLYYLKLLNEKNTFAFSLSYNQFLEKENATSGSFVLTQNPH